MNPYSVGVTIAPSTAVDGLLTLRLTDSDLGRGATGLKLAIGEAGFTPGDRCVLVFEEEFRELRIKAAAYDAEMRNADK